MEFNRSLKENLWRDVKALTEALYMIAGQISFSFKH